MSCPQQQGIAYDIPHVSSEGLYMHLIPNLSQILVYLDNAGRDN